MMAVSSPWAGGCREPCLLCCYCGRTRSCRAISWLRSCGRVRRRRAARRGCTCTYRGYAGPLPPATQTQTGSGWSLRQAEALAAYRAARSALVDELGIEPSVELRQLHEAILAQDRALLQTDPGQPAALAGATMDGRAPGHVHLPVQATPLIGRERELAELMTLADSRRLITLTGTGGKGKTRLGMAFAAGLADRYPDGAWWGPLAMVSDARLVPAAIAAA